MASIISWQFMGLPCSPSTLAAASRALVFLALACFLTLVGRGRMTAFTCRAGCKELFRAFFQAGSSCWPLLKAELELGPQAGGPARLVLCADECAHVRDWRTRVHSPT